MFLEIYIEVFARKRTALPFEIVNHEALLGLFNLDISRKANKYYSLLLLLRGFQLWPWTFLVVWFSDSVSRQYAFQIRFSN
jgi:hypothetical protein